MMAEFPERTKDIYSIGVTHTHKHTEFSFSTKELLLSIIFFQSPPLHWGFVFIRKMQLPADV